MLSIVAYSSLYLGSIWMTAFVLLNLALFLWNGGTVGGQQVINIYFACILFGLSRNFFVGRKMTILYTALKWLLAVNLIFMLMQSFGIDPLFLGQYSDGRKMWGQTFQAPTGLFALQAALGMFLAITIPFLFTGGILLPILLLIPIFVCKSAGVYLASFVAFIYSFLYIRFLRFRKPWVYAIFFTFAAGLCASGIMYDYAKDRLTGGSRFENWHLYTRMALAQPLFGYGPDSFRNRTPHKNFTFISDEDYNPMTLYFEGGNQAIASYYSADEGKRQERFAGRKPKSFSEWREAHNEYIQLFFEYGLAGLFLLGGLCREIWIRFRLSIEKEEVRVLFGAMLCYAIFSIVQFPFHLARTALFFPVFLGAFFAYTDQDWDTFVKGGS